MSASTESKITGLKAVKFLTALGLIAPFCAFCVSALSGGAMAQAVQDPPDDVARIAEIAGTVSYHEPGSQDWLAAVQNYPLAPGAGVWVEPRGHAAVDVGGARIHVDGSSELDVTAISPQAVQVSVPQGAAFLHVYPGVSGQTFEIDTPHGAAQITQPGQYEIVAGDDQHPMTVSVLEGAAQVAGQTAQLNLQAGQRGSIAPDNSSGVDAAQPDDFVRTVQADEQPYTAAVAQTAQYVAPNVPGYQDLARYGQWQQNPQYGAIWTPQQVPADWAPYRNGHWSYVAPWGWTWIDDAPWGFTPFHYGRWVQVGNRWGWTPGAREERPVYSPALVTFFGDVGAAAISLSVGWVPLGPDEVYQPPYRHSDNYLRDINLRNVRDRTKIVNVRNTTIINYNNYRDRSGATMVSRDVMVNSRAVNDAYGRPSDPKYQQQWSQARGIDYKQIGSRPTNFGKPSQGPKAVVVQNGKMQGRTVYQYPKGEVRTQPKSETEKSSQQKYDKNAVARPPQYQNGKQGNFSQNNGHFTNGKANQPAKPVYVPNANKGGGQAKPNAVVAKPQVNNKPKFNSNQQGNQQFKSQGNVAKPNTQKPNAIKPPVTGKAQVQQKPIVHNTTSAKPKTQTFRPTQAKPAVVKPAVVKAKAAKPNVAKPNVAKVQPKPAPKPPVQSCNGKTGANCAMAH